jgi:hypothetical protein
MELSIGVGNGHRAFRGRARAAAAVGVVSLMLAISSAALALVPRSPQGFTHGAPTLTLDGGAAPIEMPNAAPGDTAVSETTIAYHGSEPAHVRLYGDVTDLGLAGDLHVRVEEGSGRGRGFAALGPPVYVGTLADLPRSWASGARTAGTWSRGETRTYRISVTLLDRAGAQGLEAGATFRWEARAA